MVTIEVDEPAEQRVEPAADIAHDAPTSVPNTAGNRVRTRDLHVDLGGPDHPENIAAEIVGAERMRPGRRAQRGAIVELQRIVRCYSFVARLRRPAAAG